MKKYSQTFLFSILTSSIYVIAFLLYPRTQEHFIRL